MFCSMTTTLISFVKSLTNVTHKSTQHSSFLFRHLTLLLVPVQNDRMTFSFTPSGKKWMLRLTVAPVPTTSPRQQLHIVLYSKRFSISCHTLLTQNLSQTGYLLAVPNQQHPAVFMLNMLHSKMLLSTILLLCRMFYIELEIHTSTCFTMCLFFNVLSFSRQT